MAAPLSPSEDFSEDLAIDNLDAFVSSLDTNKKRKNLEDDNEAENHEPVQRKRRLFKERMEAGPEREFGAQPALGSKLQLGDLLAPLASTSSLQTLKKSTKPLTNGAPLSAPLPTRTQDRIDRTAAYEQTKLEVDKWKATMKRIKEADHLAFPLQVPQKVISSNSGLAAKFKPSNDMENAVDKLLRSANLRDEADINKTEELEMNHLTVEEVARRRAELRKMRDSLFYAEIKAKRAAKIKSKMYRKVQKKTRQKMKEMLNGVEGNDEMDEEEERMQFEVERARQRATLRHKKNGKWAKKNISDEPELSQKKEIEEMLDKKEQLLERIQGGSESSDDDIDEDERQHDTPEDEEDVQPSSTIVSLLDPQSHEVSNPWLQLSGNKTVQFARDEQVMDLQPLVLPDSQRSSGEMIHKSGRNKDANIFQQRDLIALAFAGDNVVEDFAKLKRQEVERDAPREEDQSLPGWGAWGGKGVKQNLNAKKIIKKIPGIDPSSRADYGKAHLIISEKRDKKAAKYLVKDLPYPYTSKAQFERSMDTPLGPEWNTRQSFQRATLPRVVKKMGTVIDPLEKIF